MKIVVQVPPGMALVLDGESMDAMEGAVAVRVMERGGSLALAAQSSAPVMYALQESSYEAALKMGHAAVQEEKRLAEEKRALEERQKVLAQQMERARELEESEVA